MFQDCIFIHTKHTLSTILHPHPLISHPHHPHTYTRSHPRSICLDYIQIFFTNQIFQKSLNFSPRKHFYSTDKVVKHEHKRVHNKRRKEAED